ncbi:MAG: hypothetical protein HY094_06195 [Candidatus Melainabacteria bacterium]|nr:hypothetical protein [Candidatus Melainabacteria bacterium]
MPTVNFQSVFSTIGRMFNSHKTLEAKSKDRLMPIKEQLEGVFKKHELNNIQVVLAYVKELWDSQFGLGGSYLKPQEQAYNKAVEETDELLRKNRIQSPLIRVTIHKYGSEVVELCPEYIYEPHGTDKAVSIFRD